MQLELIPSNLGNRETVRKNTQRGEEIVKIELSKIFIRENFNVRDDYGDLTALANSMLENGQVVPGRVDVMADGTFIITDGHRRFKAMLLLQEWGNDPLFKAIVNTGKTTEEQRILQMFTTQDNLPLQPHEIAELISRLVNLGYNQISVAKKIGRTGSYVSQMLNYAHDAPAIKDEVRKGNITVAAVLKLQKDIPDQQERIEKISNAIYHKLDDTPPISAAIVVGKSPRELRVEKFSEIADMVIGTFEIEKEDAKQTIISLLSNYF